MYAQFAATMDPKKLETPPPFKLLHFSTNIMGGSKEISTAVLLALHQAVQEDQTCLFFYHLRETVAKATLWWPSRLRVKALDVAPATFLYDLSFDWTVLDHNWPKCMFTYTLVERILFNGETERLQFRVVYDCL